MLLPLHLFYQYCLHTIHHTTILRPSIHSHGIPTRITSGTVPLQSRMSDAAKHITSGTIAGLSAKVVEYPFDTVKVRVQADPSKYKGYLHCASCILRQEGFRSFYAGIAAPMVGGGLENAVCFTSYAIGTSMYKKYVSTGATSSATAEGTSTPPPDPFMCIIAGGLTAGAAVSHVLTPVELLKCNMQVQNMLPREQRKYKNIVDCAIKMVRSGGIGALFNGHAATLAREVPGNAAWFGFYHATKRVLTPAGESPDDLPLWKLMLAGGVGGVCYWTAFFPADVVKTRMQIDATYLELGLIRGLGRCYKEGGVRTLYSGWGITAFRAFPANAIIFSVYEICAAKWDEYVDFHDLPDHR